VQPDGFASDGRLSSEAIQVLQNSKDMRREDLIKSTKLFDSFNEKMPTITEVESTST